MSQTPISLIRNLRVTFDFHPPLNSLRISTSKLGAARRDNLSINSFRKISTTATTSNQNLSVKQIADLTHHRFVTNSTSFPNTKLYAGSLAMPTSLSYGFSLSVGLAASHYLLGTVYCTETRITQTVESTPEATLFSSQSSSDNSQTTTTNENITSSSSSPDKQPFSPLDLFNVQQITFGTSMGFASGYFVKKASKTAAVLVGGIFVLLQILEQQGYITIYWNKFEENYNKILDLDKDGKVTTNDFKLIFHKVVNFLSKNFQTDASFVIGFGVGLRYG